jgi:DNA-binding MarR family transcriptional regulator
VDTLVERNYLRRDTDDADRRRVALELTDRGQAAATAVRAGVVEVDENLARRCPPAVLAALRAGLVALIDIREEREDAVRGRGLTGEGTVRVAGRLRDHGTTRRRTQVRCAGVLRPAGGPP